MFSPGFRWAEYLAWARALLALSALAGELLSPTHPSRLLLIALVCFLAYSILVAIGRREHTGVFGLLALFGDTVFLLILANHSPGHTFWLPSVFYLYLLAEAITFYGPKEVLIVVAILTAFCTLAWQNRLANLQRTAVVAGSLAVAFAITKQRLTGRIAQLIQEAKSREDETLRARDEERQRIASDFHDGALQSYISLQMRLEVLRKLLERDRAAGMEELQQLQNLAQAQVREMRAFVRSMRPVDLDGANFSASARRIVEKFQKESGIPVTFMGGDTELALPREVASDVLQMLRESLNNVQKHAGATRVAVAFEKSGNTLEISVDDNGHGFHFSGTYSLEELELLRLGPDSLKRRARAINADLTLESSPGRGAGLKLRIPLQ